jgi:hypothetical protein
MTREALLGVSLDIKHLDGHVVEVDKDDVTQHGLAPRQRANN